METKPNPNGRSQPDAPTPAQSAQTHAYLLFDLDNTCYGINARVVREVFFLPEVTPIAEAPRDIIGVFDLRGEVVPVMDLNHRLGHRRRENYQVSDSIIAIADGDLQIAAIVNRVREVVQVSNVNLTQELSYGRDDPQQRRFVRGVAQVGSQLVALLDERAIVRTADRDLDWEAAAAGDREPGDRDLTPFCPDATPDEREVFRERANSLRIPLDGAAVENAIALAVVSLQGEYFGIDLQTVREFADIRNLTPVPCCPPHILGNMNLRGEILTLIDIEGLLELDARDGDPPERAVVVQVEDIVAGIAVDEVFDVTQVNPVMVSPVPTAVRAGGDEYLRGTTRYKRTALTLLDVRRLFESGELVVEEEPRA